MAPLTNLQLVALSSGWVKASWNAPSVIIPNENGTHLYPLKIDQYNVRFINYLDI